MDRIDGLNAQQWREKYLYALADAENARKREATATSSGIERGVNRGAQAAVAICDDIDRALEAARNWRGPVRQEQLVEMLQHLQRRAESELELLGVQMVEAKGARFDPELMMSIARVPHDDEYDTVVHANNRAAIRGKQVLRPAHVAVSAGREGA